MIPPGENVLAQARVQAGGPDSFGYSYWDSRDGSHVVTYTWNDISTGGTALAFSDNKAAIDLPQPFNFYGASYNKLYVTGNGYATFKDAPVVTQCLPAEQSPAPALAAFCTELNVASGVYYSSTTYNNHDALVVQYNRSLHPTTGLTATFQLILDLEEEAVIYQYHTLPTEPVTATVAIIDKATNQTDYLVYCHQSSACLPPTGTAVKFGLPPAPRPAMTMAADNLAPETGDQVVYTLVFSNSGAVVAAGAVLTNILPAGLDYISNTLSATAGAPVYHADSRTIGWTGDLALNTPVTLTYAVQHNTEDFIYNTAYIFHPLAKEIGGATSTPVDRWAESQALDMPHALYGNLGSGRFIAVDAANRPRLAYGSSSMFYAALSGTTWISPTVSGGSASKAALAVDNAGRSAVAFLEDKSVRVARQIANAPDAGWVVDTVAEYANNWLFGLVDLQASADGRLHLAYGYDTGIFYTVYSGTAWLEPAPVLNHTHCDTRYNFSLGLDAAGQPAIACVYRNQSTYEMRLYTYSAATPWTSYQTVAANTDGIAYEGLSLAYQADTPHVSYSSGQSIYHAYNDGSWQVETVSAGLETNSLLTVLSVNTTTLAVSYGSYGTQYPYQTTLAAARKPLNDDTWEIRTVAAFTSSQTPDAPTLALDNQGNAHLAYYYPLKSRLVYALWEAGGLDTTVVDYTRRLGGASVVVGSDGLTHITYLSEGLHYLTAAADALTLTRTLVDSKDAAGEFVSAVTVDPQQTPHILYIPGDGVIYHATPDGSDWAIRPVDRSGSVATLAADSAAANVVHAAYLAEDGANYVVKHAAWNGSAWITETLAIAGPAHFTHLQKPQVAVYAGKTYVLYANCSALNPDNYNNYPIDLMLKTWDGSAWSSRTLYHYVGRCEYGALAYQLLNDHAGQIAAVAEINSADVRPNPMQLTYYLAGPAAQRQVAARPQPAGPQALDRAEDVTGSISIAPILNTGGWYDFRGEGIEQQRLNYADHIRQVSYQNTGNISNTMFFNPILSTPISPVGQIMGYSADIAGFARTGTTAGMLQYTYSPNGLYRDYPTRGVVENNRCCVQINVDPANAGTISPNSFICKTCNTVVTFQANSKDPAQWVFKEWTGDVTGSQNPASLKLTKRSPDQHTVTANFGPPSTASANKTAATISTTVYPQETINYQVQLNWNSDYEPALVNLTDNYPYPRVTVVTNSISTGPYLTCNHNAGAHAIGCSGTFPAEIVSSFLKFNAQATCDIYATQPAPNIINQATVKIGQFNFSPQAETRPAVPFKLAASSPNFIPANAFDEILLGDETPQSMVLLYTSPITGAPNCCTNCGLDVYVVIDGKVDNPLKMTNDGLGLTNPANADFISGDCHHSLWFNPTEDRAYTFDLYVVKQGDPFAAAYKSPYPLTLSPEGLPALVTLTDFRELFKEFNLTRANSAGDDSNNNCVKDYYEPVARLFEYAQKHEGVVLDVRQSIYDPAWSYTQSADRHQMYKAIDLLVAKLPLYSQDNIAIIGDDAVVPFYRVPNLESASCQGDGCNEATYTGNTDSWSDTPAGIDTAANLVLSDVPYATDNVTLPDAPQSSYAVGRIFASAPLTLTRIISGYEEPAVVDPAQTSAYVFNLANEYDTNSYGRVYTAFDWQGNTAGSTIDPLKASGYLTVTNDLTETGQAYYYGWIDGELGLLWDSADLLYILDKPNHNQLTVLNSHASHLSQTTADSSDDLFGAYFDLLLPYPGAVLVNFGCHAGYSTGFDQTDPDDYLDFMLVRGALEANLAYHASTTYGATTGGANTRFHDLVHQQFLLMLQNASTVGEARRQAVNRYQTFYTDTVRYKEGDKVTQYGTVLYGLPTQPLLNPVTGATVRHATSSLRPNISAASAGAITVTFNTPGFNITPQEDGSTWFEVSGGTTTSQGDGPVVPLLIQSVSLPHNAANVVVTLVSTTGQVYTQPVQLPLQRAGNRTSGVEEIPYSGNTPYPEYQFWTTLFTDTGQTAVYISAIPLIYNPQTDQATLLNQMQFRVTYTLPGANVVFGEVMVNNNNPVAAAQTVLPVVANVQSMVAQSLALHWLLEDDSATPHGSGSINIAVTAGGNEVRWTPQVHGLAPGNYILHLWLAGAEGKAEATFNYPLTIYDNASDRAVYLPVVLK